MPLSSHIIRVCLYYRRSGKFRCKNIFVVCANHENKKHEIQRIIIIAITFCSHNFAAQLASYFARDGLFDTSMSLVLMANTATTFHSVSDKSSVYCHSTCLRRYSVTFCTLVVRQQLHGSHERSMQAVRTLSVRSFVPDH